MKINRLELLEALNKVKSGIATNTSVKQMEHVTFTGQDIITYNNQIGILYPFQTDFEVSVNYNDLYKIISKIEVDEIDVTFSESELLIEAKKGKKKTKAGFITMDMSDIQDSLTALINQLPNEENNLHWQNLPDDFITGANLCVPAASKDITYGILACLYVHGSNLICSDNNRVSWYTLSEDTNSEFFIKASVIKEIESFGATQFCVTDSWVNFLTDKGEIFSTKLIKGKSMDYFIDLFDGFTGASVELSENLKEIVASASVMSNDDTNEMNITIQKGELICGSYNERGWVEKVVETKFKDKTPLNFNINAGFLQQILNMPLTMIVGNGRSLFESGSFKHILMHRIGDGE